ncbi:MAG TPA: hypothetical protein VGX76_08825 [Pirellulales bacterium]|jgi:Gpi18-like mannosyltransferase|nr:hypothetical protein [Pirellulales bacterium]
MADVAVAAIVGLATAARPVGIALVAPFAMYLRNEACTLREFLRRAAWLLPLACWGLAAFMIYQQAAFGDPLAFARAQSEWRQTEPPESLVERVVDLLTLRPVRAVYDSSSACFWGLKPRDKA